MNSNGMEEILKKKHIYIGQNVKIEDNVAIWDFAYISSNVSIGKNSIIGRNVYIGQNVTIGRNTKIQNNVLLYEGAIIGDNVFLGPNVVITNDLYPRATLKGNLKGKEDWKLVQTYVNDGASLAANVVVVCGNNIGAYSLVGAASVVTKEVLAYSLVIGNPAKHKNWIDEDGYPLTACGNNIWKSQITDKIFYEKNGKISPKIDHF